MALNLKLNSGLLTAGLAAAGLAAALEGCSVRLSCPLDDRTSTLYIPKDCVKIKSISLSPGGYFLCEDAQGKDRIYIIHGLDPDWKKYQIERK